MEYKEISRLLKSRNIMAVHRSTGVSVSTLRGLRDMTIVKPHVATLAIVATYLENH